MWKLRLYCVLVISPFFGAKQLQFQLYCQHLTTLLFRHRQDTNVVTWWLGWSIGAIRMEACQRCMHDKLFFGLMTWSWHACHMIRRLYSFTKCRLMHDCLKCIHMCYACTEAIGDGNILACLVDCNCSWSLDGQFWTLFIFFILFSLSILFFKILPIARFCKCQSGTCCEMITNFFNPWALVTKMLLWSPSAGNVMPSITKLTATSQDEIMKNEIEKMAKQIHESGILVKQLKVWWSLNCPFWHLANSFLMHFGLISRKS